MSPQEIHLAAVLHERQIKQELAASEDKLRAARREYFALSDAYMEAVQAVQKAREALEPSKP
jgi:hypothetical protein